MTTEMTHGQLAAALLNKAFSRDRYVRTDERLDRVDDVTILTRGQVQGYLDAADILAHTGTYASWGRSTSFILNGMGVYRRSYAL